MIHADLMSTADACEIASMKKIVPVMRELGVIQYKNIILDPNFLSPAPKPSKRSEKEQSAITLLWNKYRMDLECSLIDGTAAPIPPTEPEIIDD